ncbi:MAG: S46 family peptidase [Saprospiraceae bacterium]|nr:S46 family peptidase [Saprospiraceae bacterium]
MKLSFTKSFGTLLLFIFLYSPSLYSGEGIWLPLFLKSLNEKEMKSMGMKIKAEDIYNINKGSLKDAIVQFGGGCTSEIISSQGLLLTNHHCGYGYIQSHSSVANNILRDGFWAANKGLELPCSGLTATMIVRMEDVSTEVLMNTNDDMKDSERRLIIDRNIVEVQKKIQKKNYEDVMIRSFYNGNQFFAFVTITYKDIRLVGAPPESIGKFGADTDNWVWPRHTGDFSIFRIYANSSNLPSEYSPDNIPFTPRHFLPISLDGVSKGDFTMVFGFPGRTNEYLTQEGVRQIVEEQNPVRIKIRDEALKILDKHMRADEKTKLQYSSKYAGIANAWKKWIGESQGVKQTKGLERKKTQDDEFQKRVNADPKFEKYRSIISELENSYKELQPLAIAKEYYSEGFQRNIDLYNCYARIKRLITTFEGKSEKAFDTERLKMRNDAVALFKDVNISIEKEVFKTLLEIVIKGVDPALRVPYIMDKMRLYNRNYAQYTEDLYSQSMFTNSDSLRKLSELTYNDWILKVKADPVWMFYEELNYFLTYGIQNRAGLLEDKIAGLRRTHMKALMEVFPEKRFYPDANSTLRVSYGQVDGFSPKDGMMYKTQTYLDGVMEKYIPGDYEFDVSDKLRKLYETKDYGVYAENGKMPLAFIASNHTTGGNSGSPAIDAHGNLIGLNFDRVWEGTMSDINYDKSICRNIMLDARFILFIIDKYAGAGYLIQEMKLVHPKGKRKKGKMQLGNF